MRLDHISTDDDSAVRLAEDLVEVGILNAALLPDPEAQVSASGVRIVAIWARPFSECRPARGFLPGLVCRDYEPMARVELAEEWRPGIPGSVILPLWQARKALQVPGVSTYRK